MRPINNTMNAPAARQRSFRAPAARIRAFTLIELMVAISLGMFLVGGMVMMFASSKASSLDSEQLGRMQENIRFASDLMIRDIRNAAFRDEVSINVSDWLAIGPNYASVADVGDADSLDVRYAGRGTCVEEFDEEKLVINRYFLQDGELRCVGVNGDNPSQPLVAGLTDLQFEIICPASNAACTCTLKEANDDPDPCVGVEIRMTFEGPRGDDGSTQPREMMLSAAFRNVILDDISRPTPAP